MKNTKTSSKPTCENMVRIRQESYWRIRVPGFFLYVDIIGIDVILSSITDYFNNTHTWITRMWFGGLGTWTF